MPVSRRLRFEILRRDNHACRYCGATAPDAKLTVDHVVPVALGGTDQPDNLVTACAECNAGKSSVPADADVVDDVADDAMRWAVAMARAATLAATDRDTRIRLEKDLIELWDQWPDVMGRSPVESLPDDWYRSIHQFIAAGLTFDDLREASFTALTNRRVSRRDWWRYLCGICWRTVEQRQATARQLLDADEADPT